MAYMELDLNSLELPTMKLTLRDEAKTTLHLTIPEVKLIERLSSASAELKKIDKDSAATKVLYALIADVLNNNTEGITFKPEELEPRYGVKFVHSVYIFKAYLEFVHEVQNAKN